MAEERLIERARLVAQSRCRTLNEGFRKLLELYVSQAGSGAAVNALLSKLQHVKSSGPYTRGQMNYR